MQNVILNSNSIDGTPYAMKVACTVWSGGKDGDNFKALPIRIDKEQSKALTFL